MISLKKEETKVNKMFITQKPFVNYKKKKIVYMNLYRNLYGLKPQTPIKCL